VTTLNTCQGIGRRAGTLRPAWAATILLIAVLRRWVDIAAWRCTWPPSKATTDGARHGHTAWPREVIRDSRVNPSDLRSDSVSGVVAQDRLRQRRLVWSLRGSRPSSAVAFVNDGRRRWDGLDPAGRVQVASPPAPAATAGCPTMADQRGPRRRAASAMASRGTHGRGSRSDPRSGT